MEDKMSELENSEEKQKLSEVLVPYYSERFIRELDITNSTGNIRQVIFNNETNIVREISKLDDATLGMLASQLKKVPFGNCYGLLGRKLLIKMAWCVLFEELERYFRNKDGK